VRDENNARILQKVNRRRYAHEKCMQSPAALLGFLLWTWQSFSGD
jgi:hypothetical protein